MGTASKKKTTSKAAGGPFCVLRNLPGQTTEADTWSDKNLSILERFAEEA